MKKIIFIFLFLVFPIFCYAQPYEYDVYSGNIVVFAWTDTNSDEMEVYFDIRAKALSVAEELGPLYIEYGTTTEEQKECEIPKVGVYEFQCRACRSDTKECSEWVISTDPSTAVVDGEARAWVVRARLAPPGPPTISKGVINCDYTCKIQQQTFEFCTVYITRRYWLSNVLLYRLGGIDC